MKIGYVYAALAVAVASAFMAASAIAFSIHEDAHRQATLVRFMCASIAVRRTSDRPNDHALVVAYEKILVDIGESCP